MGRKKKKNQTDKILQVTETQSIGYQGKISVSIKRGNKTVMRKEYHNSGMPNLFRYIANILGGNLAKELRPVNVKLFNLSILDAANNEITPKTFKWANVKADLVSASPYILFDTTPIIRQTGVDEEAQYSVTLHYRIPSSYISSSVIHLVGLYPSNAISQEEDVAAYYLFTKEDNDNEWDPLVLDEAVGNYSIIIEWTLAISNKITTVTNTTNNQNSTEQSTDEQNTNN